MKKSFSILFAVFNFCFSACSMAQNSPSEETFLIPFDTDKNRTVTYREGIEFLQKLSKAYPQFIKLNEFGQTDSSEPLYEIIFEANGNFTVPQNPLEEERFVVFINNCIHPGESDGIDATLLLLRKLCTEKAYREKYKNIVLIAIPFYNVSGAMTRNSTTRANQNGALEYGFRGNAKNLDLNRDFIKCDSKNAASFNRLFQKWQPLVYLETHVSNGADYQYTMTYLATQADKLGNKMGTFLDKEMSPALHKAMKKREEEMSPYVNIFGQDPIEGWNGFVDSPRYSTGYAALFQTFSMLTETHMLKPYPDRVKATYAFIEELLNYTQNNAEKLQSLKNQDEEAIKNKKNYALQWKLDKERYKILNFKGYESTLEKSKVSGLNRMKYDRNKPYTKKVHYFDSFKPSLEIAVPQAYLIPLAYTEVLERLKWNNVQMDTLEDNQITEEAKVEVYFIEDYKTVKQPYESHYLHYETKVRVENMTFEEAKRYPNQKYVLVKLNQTTNRYIVQTLEPQGVDSFFAWNFFDGILQQKEYFSPYVFEDIAAQILEENPSLRKELEEKKKQDADFAKDSYAQLVFVYQNSVYYEKTHLKYPVLRVVK